MYAQKTRKNMPMLHVWILLIFLCSLTIIVNEPLRGAYLRNVPVQVKQPDGEILNLYATGDEFYHWVHDADGFTVIRDQKTGVVVYAILKNDELVSSGYRAGRIDPSSVGLHPYINIPVYKIKEKNIKTQLAAEQAPFRELDQPMSAPSTGAINNIVVFIRFDDEPEFTDPISDYDDMFNASGVSDNSMYNYYQEVSYGQLSVTSTFYPAPPGAMVVSYQDSHPRAYYEPYNAVTNPVGYANSTERRDREFDLLRAAVNAIAPAVPPGLNVDGDNDGLVDNVCFIVYGSAGGWSDLLWPHMWSLYTTPYVYINSKRVYTFNFQLQTFLSGRGVGVLCHEMFHSLGAPDLYHYYYGTNLSPVYQWDIMEYDLNPPQHMGAYMKYRYGDWISSIPEITTPGLYTLNDQTSATDNCYKISSPNSATEYFVVEYRRKTGNFESSLPGSGLLVYRINTLFEGMGNAQYNPPATLDEVYIYRPNGTTTTNGTPSNANFSSDVGRTEINDTTNPSSFLANGTPGGLDIWGVSSAGSTISFYYGQEGPGIDVQRPAGTSIADGGTDNTGNQTVGTVSLVYTISNTGTELLSVTDAAVTNLTNVSNFSVNTSMPFDVAVGNTHVLSVSFDVDANGNFSFDMDISNNGSGNKNPYDITVLGNGTGGPAAQIAVDPTMFSKTVVEGDSTSDLLTVSNSGSGVLHFTLPDFAAEALLNNPDLPKNRWSDDIPRLELAKNEDDPRTGHSVLLGSGGPDGYGYTWIDSDEPDGPVYQWLDISGIGTNTGLSGDDASFLLTLPFTFSFYGNIHNEVRISTNGYITFGTAGTDFSNDPIPTGADPNDFIAPFWDDLVTGSGSVYYYHDTSNGRLIIQYSNVERLEDGGTFTFQVQLFEYGAIYFYYNTMSGTLNSATTGLENSDASDGLEIAFNTNYVHNQLAVYIAKPPEYLRITPISGTIDPGGSTDLTVWFTARLLGEGTYQSPIHIWSNDPVQPLVTVPTTLNVSPGLPPEITVNPASFDETMMPENTITRQLTLGNTGQSVLNYNVSLNMAPVPLGRYQIVSAPSKLNPLSETHNMENLSRSPSFAGALPFSDGFEDGTFDDWFDGGGTGVKEVTDLTAAEGIYSFHYEHTTADEVHYSGIYQEFPSGSQCPYIGFYIRSGSTSEADAYFVITSDSFDDIIWFYAKSTGNLYINDVAYETVSYQALQWYHIEFKDIDWINHHFDYYVNGSLIHSDIPMRDASSYNIFYLDLYNYSGYSEAWWDDIHLGTEETWLTLIPANPGGQIPGGESADVGVQFNSAGLTLGETRQADIIVQSNDADEGEIIVPVSLYVGQPVLPIADLRASLESSHILLEWSEVPAASGYCVYRDTEADLTPDIAGGSNRIAENISDEDAGAPGVQWTDPAGGVYGGINTHYFWKVTAVCPSQAVNPHGGTAGMKPSGVNHTVTGQVFNSDLNHPAEGDIGFSAFVTARTGEVLTESSAGCGYTGGYWTINAGNFETSWAIGEVLHLEVQNVSNGQSGILDCTLTLDDPDVVPDLTLANLVEMTASNAAGEFAYPLLSTAGTDINEIVMGMDTRLTRNPVLTAEDMANAIPNCTVVYTWDAPNQGAVGHPKGLPFNNFDVYAGFPYAVNVPVDGTWTVTGSVPDTSFSLITTPGTDINHIGVPFSKRGLADAEALVNDIPSGTTVYSWVAQQQGAVGHPAGLPFNNFEVKANYPYYVNVTADNGWPSGGTPGSMSKIAVSDQKNASQSERSPKISGGIPHLAYGRYYYNEDIPRESITGVLKMKAWIAGRSEEVLTEETVGAGYDSTYWWMNVGNFDTAWQAGETLIVVLEDSANGLSGRGQLNLTNEGTDILDSLMINEPLRQMGILEDSGVPSEYRLVGNYPNPFNPNTLIVYQMPERAEVSIIIYDVRGQRVRELCSEMKEAGTHKVEWDAADDSGRRVMSGVYLCRMKTGSYVKTRKMVLIK
jgi:M6 family metalloprotease-like protein